MTKNAHSSDNYIKKTNKKVLLKVVLSTLFLISFQFNYSFAQCTHSIDLTDTYGDGWNGGAVTVYVNGSPVLSGITLGSGYGPSTFTFTASSGDAINVIRTIDGSWPSEMRVYVYQGAASIIALHQPLGAPGTNGTGLCPEHCYTPTSYDYSITPNTSWQTHSGNYASGGCRIYRISVTSGNLYDFTTCSIDGVGGASSGDIDFRMYDNSGAYLWYIDGNSGCSWAATTIGSGYFNWNPGYTGYAYLQICHYSSCPSSVADNWTLAYKCINPCTPPTAVTVSGGGTFCNSATLTAANGGSGTIYWQNTTSGGTSTATPSISQVVTASGTYYFRAYNGSCWGPEGSATVTITPNASITSVTGTSPLCIGGTATYTANGVVLGGGTGAWSSSNTAVATVNAAGLVTGVAAGTCNIIYTITGGCGGIVSRQQSVTINPNASIASVSGSTPICIGATATYTANTVVLGGGTGAWSSSNTAIATVSAGGVVTGVSAGTCNIIYTITGGCGGVVSRQQAITVSSNASITSVTGSTPLCAGGTASYTANGVVLSGGTGAWSSSNTGVATVNASGVVTTVAAGTCNIIYTITGGCGGVTSAQQSLTVTNCAPVATQLVFPSGGPKTYVVLSNGTSSSGAYLVVGNPASNAIVNGGNTGGWIISENQYHYLAWKQIAAASSFIIPFGYSTSHYLPYTFSKTAGAASDLIVSTWGTGSNNLPWAGATNVAAVANMYDVSTPGIDGSIPYVIDRWWTINASGATASMAFSYRGEENTMTSGTGAILGIQHWNGTYWNNGNGGAMATITSTGSAGGTGAGTSHTVALTSTFTEFSPYVLVSLPNPLPVELLGFTAECQGSVEVDGNEKNVLLKWTTASENNAESFTIERSLDGNQYVPIASLAASGYSNTEQQYSYSDNITNGTNEKLYYRLLQTDFNGESIRFSPVSVICPDDGGFTIAVFPNPVKDGNVSVVMEGCENEEVVLSMCDVIGKQVFAQRLTPISANDQFNIKLGDQIAPGVYFFNISVKNKQISKKLVITN